MGDKVKFVKYVIIFLGVIFLLTLPAGSQGKTPFEWLKVKAWKGKFRTTHKRHEEIKRDFLGFSGETKISDHSEGSFLFNRAAGPGTWNGGGRATWSVDEYSKSCPGNPSVRCRETEAKGGGTISLGGTNELTIEPREGTYDLVLNLGGDHLEGMVVQYREIPLGGKAFKDPTGEGPRATSRFPKGPGDVELVAYKDAFHVYFEDSVFLPKEGNDLCGCQRRSDGTIIAWKIWPEGEKEPPCPQIKSCE